MLNQQQRKTNKTIAQINLHHHNGEPVHQLVNLHTYKTQYCTKQHHPLDSPYYLDCQKYHSWQDHRRNPYTDNASVYSYDSSYLGEGYDDKKYCLNWVEYLYHPVNYKKMYCYSPFIDQQQQQRDGNIGKQHQYCHFKYCAKIHKNQEQIFAPSSNPVAKKNQKSSSLNKNIHNKSAQKYRQKTPTTKNQQVKPITQDKQAYTKQYQVIYNNLNQLKQIRNYQYGEVSREEIYAKYGGKIQQIRGNISAIRDKIIKVEEQERRHSMDVKNRIIGLAAGVGNKSISPKINNQHEQRKQKQQPSQLMIDSVIPSSQENNNNTNIAYQQQQPHGQSNIMYIYHPILPFQNNITELYRGQQLSIIEDRHNQFKMFVNKDPRKICSLLLEYISAFINSEGGNIYLGVDDSSIVQGLDVPQKWIDQLLLGLDIEGKVQLEPPLTPQKYRVKIIPVRNTRGQWLNVIEVTVYPSMDAKNGKLTLYNRQCYLRMNASNHRMCAADIIEYMRIANNNIFNQHHYNPPLSGNNIKNMNLHNLSAEELKQLNQKIVKAQQQIQAVSQ